MECPHFTGMYMKYCAAKRETYVPSIYEMSEYCKQSQHRICWLYMRTDNGPVKAKTPRDRRNSVSPM